MLVFHESGESHCVYAKQNSSSVASALHAPHVWGPGLDSGLGEQRKQAHGTNLSWTGAGSWCVCADMPTGRLVLICASRREACGPLTSRAAERPAATLDLLEGKWHDGAQARVPPTDSSFLPLRDVSPFCRGSGTTREGSRSPNTHLLDQGPSNWLPEQRPTPGLSRLSRFEGWAGRLCS